MFESHQTQGTKISYEPLIILNLKENWNLIFQFIYSFNIILSWELTSVQNKSQVHTTWWIFCQKTLKPEQEWSGIYMNPKITTM
jgi:hypothetical protein